VKARFGVSGLRFSYSIALSCLLLSPSGKARGETTSSELRPPSLARTSPITRQEVWQAVAEALRQAGVSEAQLPMEEAIDMPVSVPAGPQRKLRVASSCWEEGSGRLEFLLQCAEPGECLPFLVFLNGSTSSPTSNLLSKSAVEKLDSFYAQVNARTRSCRVRSGTHSAPSARIRPDSAAKSLVRSGEEATAEFVGSGMRMTASVTCLERGGQGEVIRVRGVDGNIFRARISGPGRLQVLPQ
jgi:hypothetical protein